jgi:peptidoglycan lytic transglycosylase
MIWLLALLLPWEATAAEAPGTADPRIEWVELQRAGRYSEALAAVDRHLLLPETSRLPGVYYLRGRLLEQLGQRGPATAALASALGLEHELEPWTRYRLAEVEMADGHPEVAAGLLATLLGDRPAPELGERAAVLLAGAMRHGGDCRLLAGLDAWRLTAAGRRPLRLARADCAAATAADRAVAEWTALLAEDGSDAVALAAAERLAAAPTPPSPEVALDIAMAAYEQRSFELALTWFAHALEPGGLPPAQRSDYDTNYAIARSAFWLGDYAQAAARFADLARLTRDGGLRAQALYQGGRSLELGRDPAGADGAFAETVEAAPDSGWAAAAVTSRLRIAWLEGRETDALAFYAQLGDHRRWRDNLATAALFLAASDLVRERADHASGWLATAAATPDTHAPEIAYWLGRLAEVEGDPRRAVRHYAEALVAAPYDPWSEEGRARLAGAPLAAETQRTAAALAASADDRDLLAAWRLAPASAAGQAARQALTSRLERRASQRDFMRLTALPAPAWDVWSAPADRAEERLLGLGDWESALPVLERHFPLSDDVLALTRARFLAEAGLTRPSIHAAEVVAQRAPPTVPVELWPPELVHSLYPLGFGELLRREAAALGLDPLLLAALVREESRFDASATSAAAARGLTQFVLPTARRLGPTVGLQRLEAHDLHRPEVAIRLGAAYVAELAARFGGREHMMLAGYNAGEPQAELWRAYCVSDERAEYLTKIGFRETRSYVRKVLASYARYRALYPAF